jgi:CRP-like cAMP-binding protein
VHAGATETATGAGRVSIGRPETVWVVLRGAVAILPPTTGRRCVAGVAGPGESFGPVDGPTPYWSQDGTDRTVWIRGLIPSRLLEVDSAVLTRVCLADPAVSFAMFDLLRLRAEQAERRLIRMQRLSAEGRLLSELRDLAERFGSPCPASRLDRPVRGVDGRRIAIPLTQDLLADLTGGVRETVNRSLRALAARGVVERRGLAYTVFGPSEVGGDSDPSSGDDGLSAVASGDAVTRGRRRRGAVVGGPR